jgi:hypothetical protein
MFSDIKDLLDRSKETPLLISTRKQSSLYPSSASIRFVNEYDEQQVVGECLRKQFYSYMGVKSDRRMTARSRRIIDLGDIICNMWVDDFKKLGIYVDSEVPFYMSDIGVSGRVDIIVKDPYRMPRLPNLMPSPEDLIGIEMKSTGGYQNIKGPVISTRDTPLMPKIEHILQTALYLDYYSKFGISKWVLIYVDRTSMDWEAHLITIADGGYISVSNRSQNKDLTHITISGIKERFKELWGYIDTDTLPPRDYVAQYSNDHIKKLYSRNLLNKTDMASVAKKLKKKTISDDDTLIEKGDVSCSYCDYKEKCWSNSPTVTKRDILSSPIAQVENTPSKPDIVSVGDFI